MSFRIIGIYPAIAALVTQPLSLRFVPYCQRFFCYISCLFSTESIHSKVQMGYMANGVYMSYTPNKPLYLQLNTLFKAYSSSIPHAILRIPSKFNESLIF